MHNFQHSSKKVTPLILFAGLLVIGAVLYYSQNMSIPKEEPKESTAVKDRWKDTLTSEQYHVLREGGTETPFTGALNHETRKGTYYSVGCDKPLFRSEQKYDSGTGWPSFWAPIKEDALVLRKEGGLLDDRIEVLDTCGSHLGHVFDDGPKPTGKRFCMNSVALYFVSDEK
jgi:peptide-methionine (R)-S-oxide reductase